MDLSVIFLYAKAILRELWLHKFKAVLMGFACGFALLMLGVVWPVKYEASMIIYADNQNILAPLLENQARVSRIKVDQSKIVRDVMLSPRILNKVLEDIYQLRGVSLSPEQVEEYARRVRANMVISRLGADNISISYTSNSADDTYDLLNAISDEFIEDASQKKRSDSREAFLFIDNQVKQFKDQLLAAEEALKQFNANNLDGTFADVASRIRRFQDEIEKLTLEIDEIRARINSLNVQLNQESRFSAKQYKADIYRERIIELQNRKDTLLLSLTESHPDVVRLNYQIEDAQSELNNAEQNDAEVSSGDNSTINPLYEDLRSQLASAKLDLESKERLLGANKKLLEKEFERKKRIADREAELSEITRDYAVTKDKYDEMLNQKEKARLSMTISLEGQGVTYKIKEPPQYPLTPKGLRFVHFVILGFVVMLIFPVGIFSAYTILDARLRFAFQLKNVLEDTPLMAVIPHELSPIGQRLLRKDIILTVLMIIFFMSAYMGVATGYKLGVF